MIEPKTDFFKKISLFQVMKKSLDQLKDYRRSASGGSGQGGK